MQLLSRKRRLSDFISRVWDNGDLDAVDADLADTYTIHHDPGDPWDGQVLDRAGFKDRVAKSRAAFPDQHFDIQALIAEGDSVVMTWLWTATHTGDLPGFPATGRPVRMSGATVYGFDQDLRLTGHWQITDRLGVYQQLQQNLAAQSGTG
ncbi:MAG TPA: ester cyclase [Novosphingobium sp.]|nr:ester cyclase [Novosphingobium sp.]HQA17546.1 ester cyclase [Novosphingobium sp.]